METTQFISTTRTRENVKAGTLAKLGKAQLDWFEKGRYGIMAIMLTLQSCLGGIACMYILSNDAGDVWLSLCAVVTMGANAVMIAQAGPKACLAGFYTAVIVNTLLIAFNF